MREFHRWSLESPHKGSGILKAFPCRCVIIAVWRLGLQPKRKNFYDMSHGYQTVSQPSRPPSARSTNVDIKTWLPYIFVPWYQIQNDTIISAQSRGVETLRDYSVLPFNECWWRRFICTAIIFSIRTKTNFLKCLHNVGSWYRMNQLEMLIDKIEVIMIET